MKTEFDEQLQSVIENAVNEAKKELDKQCRRVEDMKEQLVQLEKAMACGDHEFVVKVSGMQINIDECVKCGWVYAY